ncbi:class I SAM-dependent methyltransferase [Candidatus Parcubacteria bacterium]|nr:class I SAM-dependent methyltransferase [Candidatus Parcubacteria bacterium]
MKASYYDVLFEEESNHWWYKVRRGMTHFLIKKYGGPMDGSLKILDMGCGTGALLGELERHGEATGIDFSDKAVTFCKQRGIQDVRPGRAENLPAISNLYDVVLALDVIEHVGDDVRAIQELKRVARPGGVVIIFVPAFMFLWGVTDEVAHHFRRYTKSDLEKKVREAGLNILRASYFNTFLFLPILIVRKINKSLPQRYKPENEVESTPGILNSIFYMIFKIESWLFRLVDFPFGVSLCVIAEKPEV